MRLNYTDIRRKWQFPVLLATVFAPLPAVILAFLAPTHLPLAWLLPAAYLLLAFPCLVIPGKVRRLYGIAACAMLLFVTVPYVLRLSQHLLILLIPLLYGGLILATLPMAGYSWAEEPPGFLLWLGLILHTAQYILLQYSIASQQIPRHISSPAMFITFSLFLFLGLLSRNRAALAAISAGKTGIPAFLQKKNRLFVICFVAGVFLLGSLPAVSAALYRLLLWLIELFWLLLLSVKVPFISMPEQATEATEPTETVLLEGLPSGEPNKFVTAMEPVLLIVFWILIVLAVITCIVFLILLLVRLLRKLARWSTAALSYYNTASTEDYEDEITDTRGIGETASVGQARSRKLSFLDERKLPPRERIRYRYQRLLKKHPQWHGSSTARENLADEAANLYEKARYSEKDLTAQDAEHFQSRTKNL